MAVHSLTKSEFIEKIYNIDSENKYKFLGDKPAVIDFNTLWCMPCKTVAPILEELSIEYQDIDFYKIDIDAENELAGVFNVKSIPTFLFIPKEGQPMMTTGAMNKEGFKSAINEIIQGD